MLLFLRALVNRGLLTGCSREDISKLKHLPLEDLADVSDKLLPAQVNHFYGVFERKEEKLKERRENKRKEAWFTY